MLPVFGRASSATHPLCPALRSFIERQAGNGDEDAAVAFNLMDDHRVPPARENLLIASVGGPSIGAAQFKEAFTNFFWNTIRTRKQPDFVLPLNDANKVSIRTGFDGDGLHPGQQLVRILNLSKLERVYRNYSGHSSGQFSALENDSVDFPKWLSEKCAPNNLEMESFIEATLFMLNTDRLKHPYQPVWATLWEQFEPHLAHPDGATRWRQALGLKPSPRPEWFIVLAYPASLTGDLYRPTMLEADWYCHHYPSPEGVSVAQGGFAMDCRGENPAPLSEFVHQQIDHKLEHWTSTKSKPSLAEMADPIGLLDQRRYHHECLLSRFGQSARRWSA